MTADERKTHINIDPTFLPICPNWGAEGERQRKARGRFHCKDCGEVYNRD